MDLIKEYQEQFQAGFKDLDNTTFLVEVSKEEAQSFHNYEVHVHLDYIIKEKFFKMIKFYHATKKNLFPKNLFFRYHFIQSLKTNLHSISLNEFFINRYRNSTLLKDNFNTDVYNLKKRARVHDEFFNQVYTTFIINNFINRVETTKKPLSDNALIYSSDYSKMLKCMLYVTKSHNYKNIYETINLTNECEKLAPGIGDLFTSFELNPTLETLQNLSEEFNKYYIFSHFSEFCQDNMIAQSELLQYEKIIATDIKNLLLPFEVKPIENEDFGAFIEDIQGQTKGLYTERLNKIHQYLNFQ